MWYYLWWFSGDLAPWLYQIILTNGTSRNVEIKDPIPEKDRPKGKSEIAELASDFHFDGATRKLILIIESSTSYDKDIPDPHALTQILVVYGILLDIDNTRIDTMIHQHQRILA